MDLNISSNDLSPFLKDPKIKSLAVQKVYNYILKLEKKEHFIDQFCLKNGKPVWDKALVFSDIPRRQLEFISRNNLYGNIENTMDTVVFIPLANINEERVVGFIKAHISNEVYLSYSLDEFYKNYSFNLQDHDQSAKKFAELLMYLNALVYEKVSYKVLDKRLYKQQNQVDSNIIDIKVNLEPDYSRLASLCYTTTVGTITYDWHCTRTGDCTSGNCDRCEWCVSVSYGVTTEINCVNEQIGGPSTISSSGGGGGGNSPIPPYYPCIPTNTPLLPDTSGLPCPYPGPGVGWEENNFNLNNPCSVLDSLLKINKYKNALKKIKDSVSLGYERGVSIRNLLTTFDTTEYSGNGTNLAVEIILAQPSDAIFHNHNNNPRRIHNFSAEDIYKLAEYFRDGLVSNTKLFTFAVVTDSTSYILMIKDSAAFATFAQTWLNTSGHFKSFARHLYANNYYALDGNSILQDEVYFLKALQAAPIYGAGLKLFKGNNDMSVFTPIIVDANDKIKIDPCL